MKDFRPPALPDLTGIMEDRRKYEQANAGRFDAEGIFNHLMNRVKTFEKEIAADQEVGIQLANFGPAGRIHIRSISFKNPNLVEFHGFLDSEQKVTLVQHISQLSFLLLAVKPIEEKPYRIGFV